MRSSRMLYRVIIGSCTESSLDPHQEIVDVDHIQATDNGAFASYIDASKYKDVIKKYLNKLHGPK